MIPIVCQEDMVAALPAHLVRFERFSNCGHSVIAGAPLRTLRGHPQVHRTLIRFRPCLLV
jgi:hypothetical protein